ncbi:MAG: hypothetical protein A2365_01190 [Candidatus Nealsonbacteria bacterium RIFOXYB1_FULL_40_15]|uniref:TrbC/VIRB2 family protein n=2 Tax=Candidatus Nealsoniibacteriota TaxID=1817911 RepID=A0A1G2ELI2_9BACT|nr:MAG: hypothetical protein A2427_04720 [Candidatus Nealsonbacteria bacterium RIFOXYC1_FULL_40_7]OGZ26885.1 MAG: hypothetical protein A2365_01190 [Candidatus Nealsonbacteria bacterium RIFOXYB1_FULL_40_15]OGZ29310.1 MAG: hypothetical protein A2562_01645 [Candidatus Nealsonbacteria bacterium RIFOXYD1_FULL_39_11]
MKKHINSLLAFLLLSAFFVPLAVSAARVEIPNPFGPDSTIWTILGRLINWAFYIAAFGGVIAICVAAFIFLTSAGDPEKVKKGRNLITWAIIGIIVIFLSKGIINLLLEILGAEARIE